MIGLCTLRTYPCHKEKHDKARLLARCGEYKARVSPFRRLQRRDTSGTDMSVISVPGVLARQPFQAIGFLAADVVPSGHDAGISKKAIKLKPVAVVKG